VFAVWPRICAVEPRWATPYDALPVSTPGRRDPHHRLNSFLDLLRTQQRFLLTGHENPDGDCVGAEVALFHLLRGLGKQVVICNPDPLAKSFRFLERHTPFQHWHPSATLPEFEVAVLLDCCQLSRLGGLAAPLRAAGRTITVIDHHVGSERGDGQPCYVDATAAATGALVRRLYEALGQSLTLPAAEGVFLSLVADTGWFRYSNSDAEVFRMAAEMVAAGVDGSAVYDQLYRQNHPDSAGILAAALQRHELRCGGRLALASLDRDLMQRAASADFETDAVLDPLRSLVGVEVVALLKERGDGQVRLSLRARGDVDVQRIAATFGGGGHKKAAGASLGMSLPAAIAAVERAVLAALPTTGLVGPGAGTA
jgi:bifunctional oligoribonuclease and PAP phosphatase NrnA